MTAVAVTGRLTGAAELLPVAQHPGPGGRTQLVRGVFRGLEPRAICPRTSKQLFRL